MGNKRIIALYSPRPECGKSTLASFIGGVVISFATPMRRMIAVLLIEAGYSEEEAWHYLTKDKNTPLEKIPGQPTARHLLRTLGTEWGRNHVCKQLWTELGVNKATAALAASIDSTGTIDDLRFENEAYALQDAGALLVRITRSQAPLLDGEHASDGGLNHWKGPEWTSDRRRFDMEIVNDDDTTDQLKLIAMTLKAIALGFCQPPATDGWRGPKVVREDIRTGKAIGMYVRNGETQWRDGTGAVVDTQALFAA